jgi:KaiC/GvpD/RAD55 family RecA-like ATPase
MNDYDWFIFKCHRHRYNFYLVKTTEDRNELLKVWKKFPWRKLEEKEDGYIVALEKDMDASKIFRGEFKLIESMQEYKSLFESEKVSVVI